MGAFRRLRGACVAALLCRGAALLGASAPGKRVSARSAKAPYKKKGFGDVAPAKQKAPTGGGMTDSGVGTQSDLLQKLLDEEKDRRAKLQEDIEDLRERDKFVSDNSDAGRIPDVIATRMGARMAVLGGVPIFGGYGLFAFFYIQSTQFDNVFQPTQVAFLTTLPWLIGLLGVTFGIASTSWDEDREGSLLGFDEVKTNLERTYDGLKRSARDADLRDRY